MARRSRRRTGYLEKALAGYVATLALVAAALASLLGVTLSDAARLAAVGAAALVAARLLVLGLAKLQRQVKGTAEAGAAKGATLPAGFVHRIDHIASKRIRAQAALISRKRSQCWDPGARGQLDQAQWTREQNEIIDQVLLAGVPEKGQRALKRRAGLIASWRRKIDDAANDFDRARASAGRGVDFRPGMEGFEYEAYVSYVLTKAGWKVWNKRDTGDQGVDVVAEGFGVIMAIQCKRYRGSVGNEAVQQIYAGRLTVSPHARAAVCTNADYTRSAKELADATGVLLLHHDDLPRLAELVKEPVRELNKAA